MTRRSSVFRVALALGISVASSAHIRTISQKTAHKLVQEAAFALGENEASAQVGTWEYYWAPEFYTFSASRHNLADGLLVTHYFAVNPWTGDVWDAMGCKRITSPTIEKEQESIRKQAQLPADVWAAIRNKSPADCSTTRK